MKHPEFDKEGYPTEETLAYIENYSGGLNPIPLVEFILEAWAYPDYAVWNPPILELHTGGWSGNESIIAALEKTMFWALYWQKSERGGHYYFKIDWR